MLKSRQFHCALGSSLLAVAGILAAPTAAKSPVEAGAKPDAKISY